MEDKQGNRNYREVTKADWRRFAWILLIFVLVITASSFLLLPGYWSLWFFIIFVITFLLIAWHTKNFAYQCPKCDEIFEISIITNFLGPNNFDRKYLKCPLCGKRGWAKVLKIVH
ncbi:hypothetical protein V7O62_04390 [Methanolobus sp. ZRKC2]|uniref:hypothetical protein n=1 Tax=Methanolobus sp. ZRKC2 TaxID=3125783 RepID=UPI00325536F0